MDFRFLAALGMTMALRRPHKGMKTGWRRERATTRVAPTTGLSVPIFIAMTGRRGWIIATIPFCLPLSALGEGVSEIVSLSCQEVVDSRPVSWYGVTFFRGNDGCGGCVFDFHSDGVMTCRLTGSQTGSLTLFSSGRAIAFHSEPALGEPPNPPLWTPAPYRGTG